MKIIFGIIGGIILLPIAIVLAIGLAGGVLAGLIYLFADILITVAAMILAVWGIVKLLKWLFRKA